MEKINKYNYEAWVLDYSENNLSERQIQELDRFLSENPDLQQELEGFEIVSLQRDEKAFIDKSLKSSLLREESTGLTRKEFLMINEVEGKSSKVEKAELASLIAANPELMDELIIYQKTKLQQVTSVVFPDKSSLIRKDRKIIAWWTYASTAAAAAVIAFVIWNTNLTTELYTPRAFAWSEKEEMPDESLSVSIIHLEVEVDQKETQKEIIQIVETKKAQIVKPVITRKEAPLLADIPLQEVPSEQITLDNPEEKEELALPDSPNTLYEEIESSVVDANSNTLDQEYLSIKEFAKNKVKNDWLKGKTFSETVVDEIAEISNDKVSFKLDERKGRLFESFALNLGIIGVSRNR